MTASCTIILEEKKDVIAELFLVIEHDELLPDSIDGYEIARKILKLLNY